MATNMLEKTYSQSVTVKKQSNFTVTPDSLFLKTLIEGDFRQFQTSITLLVKKYFLMSLLQ